MKYLKACLVIITIHYAITCTAKDRRALKAVSNFEIAEALYRRLKNENPTDKPLQTKDVDTKNQICLDIASSGYVKNYLEEAPVYVDQMYLKLKNKYAHVFLSLFEPPPDETPGKDVHLVYTNRTVQKDVKIRMRPDEDYRIFQDEVFTCLTTAVDDETGKEALGVGFVTGEYNVSDTRDSDIVGRFLLFHVEKEEDKADECDDDATEEDDDEDEDYEEESDEEDEDEEDVEDDDEDECDEEEDSKADKDDEKSSNISKKTSSEDEDSKVDEDPVEVYAIAEEPAESLSKRGSDVERAYLKQKAGHKPEANENDDPVCKMNRMERMRACTLLLSSEYFEDKVVFKPAYSFVDEKCTKMEISFEDEQVKSEAGEEHFEEWMFGCRLEKHSADFRDEYFVSRVYDSDTKALLFRKGKDLNKVVPENLFGDVRFRI